MRTQINSDQTLRALDSIFARGRPTSSQALQTQSEILRAALALFNERGTHVVTTHEIAEKAKISPGNLYYHFKNKEEIIRSLFWQIDLFSHSKWAGRAPLNPKESMVDFMRFFFGELKSYHFFFRDFALLLRNDAVLEKIWRFRYEHLFSAMKQAANLWVQAGILKPFKSEQEVDAFIENFWILANFSGVHLENRQSVQKSTELLIQYLYPYHSEKGQRVLDLYKWE